MRFVRDGTAALGMCGTVLLPPTHGTHHLACAPNVPGKPKVCHVGLPVRVNQHVGALRVEEAARVGHWVRRRIVWCEGGLRDVPARTQLGARERSVLGDSRGSAMEAAMPCHAVLWPALHGLYNGACQAGRSFRLDMCGSPSTLIADS